MKCFRATSAVLICVSMLSLTACSGDDDTTTAGGSAPTAAVSAPVDAPAAPTSAAVSPPAAASKGDKTRCAAADQAGEAMKSAFVKAMGAGEVPSPDELKKILGALDRKLTAASTTEGPSPVSAAMKKMAAEASRAAGSADPIQAAANPDFEQAGAELTAACRAAGVTVTF